MNTPIETKFNEFTVKNMILQIEQENQICFFGTELNLDCDKHQSMTPANAQVKIKGQSATV